MRIVQIIDQPCDIPVSGADLRNEAIFRALREYGSTRQIAAGDLVGAAALSIATGGPSQTAADDPDVVVAEGVALLDRAIALRDRLPPSTRIVIDFHNVESALLEEQDRARLPRPLRPLAPTLFAGRWKSARQADCRAIARADAIWTCSGHDETAVRSLAGRDMRCAVIPNPVPPWCAGLWMDERSDPRDGLRILFLGHLGYPPNKAAVRRLVGTIMPRAAARFPGVRLTVAGRAPNARLTAQVAASPHAVLVPDPPDLEPLYREADMVLLPIAEGGGTRIKVIEALAVGCPVVASAKAVEGLHLEPGRHFLAAETPRDCIAAVEALVENADLRARLRAEGAMLVRTRHEPAAIAHAVKRALDDLMGGAARPRLSTPA